jgi:hypothetical protein
VRWSEAEHARRLVGAFIDARPSDVTIIRTPGVADAAGGHATGAAQTLTPQRARIVKTSRQVAPTRQTIDGDIVTVDALLIGSPTLDVERGDRLEDGTSRFEVVFVHPDRSEETRSELILRGDA